MQRRLLGWQLYCHPRNCGKNRGGSTTATPTYDPTYGPNLRSPTYDPDLRLLQQAVRGARGGAELYTISLIS